MALNATTTPVSSRDINTVILTGHFSIGAAGAPTKVAGRGMTLNRDAVGDYTVVLTNTSGGVPEILHATAMLNIQSDIDHRVFGKGFTGSAGARTNWSFSCLDGVTPTDPTSGDTLTIMLVVRNSSRG